MLVYGNKGFTVATVKYWRDDVSKGKKYNKKTGEFAYPKVPMYIKRIWVEIATPTGNGLVWVFTGMKYKGEILYTDGRRDVMDLGTSTTEKRRNGAELRTEIARMTSLDFANQVFAALELEVDGEEYANMIGAHYVQTFGIRDVRDDETNKVIGSEDYEGREMEGGYIDRVKAATQAVKDKRLAKTSVNRRKR